MTIADSSTPVVVLGSGHHTGLGVTRSLGRLGVRVFNIDSTRSAPVLLSRYCRGKFIWDFDNVPPEKAVQSLTDATRKVGRRCILIPTSDRAAMFVADHAAVLKEWFLFPAQTGALVHSLYSKKEMYHLARKLRVPTPRTFCPQTRADLLEYLESVDLPIMIKGIDGQHAKNSRKPNLIIRARRELPEVYDLIRDAPVRRLIVQEYIPGGKDTVWLFNGYFNERAEYLVGFTGRRLRQCPVYTGVTSLGICQKNEIVEQTVKKFMKALGYRGILDIEFCYDARDGQYKVLDVNPRIGAEFRLFVSAEGMDVARALYLDLTGQPVTPALAPEGRKWMVEDFDLVSSFRYHRDGKLTVWEWLRSLGGIQESALLALDDPLPMLLTLRADVSELWQRLKPFRQPDVPFEHRQSGASVVSTSDEEKACY
jgi:predicted ATP-grasp superfamily ATP-dependent carboligase